jgi:FixJ family two-component response regulator
MTPSDKICPTVFVVADDQQLLDSLEILLDVLGFAVRPFTSLAHFLSFYRPQMPGCLLFDLHVADASIQDVYAPIKERGLRLATIVIAESADTTATFAPAEMPDLSILARPLERDALIDSVNQALALDARWRQRDAECAALEGRIRRLSDRDRETLQMILAGEPAKSLAARFFLSERAAKMRRSALLRKLKVRSIAELNDLTAGNEIQPEPTGSASERQL